MAIKISFSIPPNSRHASRKVRNAAKRHGVKLESCKMDRYGYYVTCSAPCGTNVVGLKRTKRLKVSHVSYAGCDR